MKTNLYCVLAFCGLLTVASLSSCESKKTDDAQEALTDRSDNETDSKEMAEDQNDETFDDSEIKSDAEFAVEAADGGMLEVELGKLAQSKGTLQSVKDFGKQMEKDHSKANQELKALASSKGIALPQTLSEKSQKEYDKMAEKSGDDFDKEYIDLMVSDHKKDVKAFEKEAEKGNDAEIKAFASKTLPTLRHHLDMIQTIQDNYKK